MSRNDLVILVPDGAYREVLQALLARPKALGLRSVSFQVVVDSFRDSSSEAVNLLRPFQRTHSRALVFRDFEGSGKEQVHSPTNLERELENEMSANGWPEGHARAVVAVPEIEDWLRLPSPHVLSLMNGLARKHVDDLVDQLVGVTDEQIVKHGGRNEYGKPCRPKEVFEDLLDHFGIRPSNSHYRYLAEHESLKSCSSPSFQRLVKILKEWFPAR